MTEGCNTCERCGEEFVTDSDLRICITCDPTGSTSSPRGDRAMSPELREWLVTSTLGAIGERIEQAEGYLEIEREMCRIEREKKFFQSERADQAEAREAKLRAALVEIAHNTSTSIPLGEWEGIFYGQQLRRCIGMAADALAETAP